jgi:hypothetical protein
MPVDPLFAQWLQAAADYAVSTDGDVSSRWGTTALSTERVTGIATRAAALIEGNRQLAFLSRGPFAIEAHQLVGADWVQSIGTVVTLSCDDLGYAAGLNVFVLDAEDDHSTGLSVITVLRPLRSGL